MLPFEIVLNIIDTVGDKYLDSWGTHIEEKQTLIKVALLCKACRDQAYRYLHGYLECNSDKELGQLLSGDLEHHAHVHTLTLTFDPSSWGHVAFYVATSHPLSSLFGSLPRLTKLIIRGLNISWSKGLSLSVRQDLLRLLSSGRLSSLDIVTGPSMPAGFLKCLSTSITSLSLYEVRWEDKSFKTKDDPVDDPTFHSRYPPLHGLKTLKVVNTYYSSLTFALHELIKTKAVELPNLEAIVLAGHDSIEGPLTVTTLLATDLPNLKHIEFTDNLSAFNESSWNDPREAITLDSFHAFESISLPDYFRRYANSTRVFPRPLVKVLKTLTKPGNLKRLHLKIHWSRGGWENLNTDDVLAPPWSDLDEVLTGTPFSTVKEVVLDMTAVRHKLWKGMDFGELKEELRNKALPNVSKAVDLKILL